MKLIIKKKKKVLTAIQNGEDYRYDIHTTRAQGIPVSTESDLISRSDLKQTINKVADEEIRIDEKWAKGLKYSLKLIDSAPTIEPKKEIVPVCKVTFDKEELQKMVDEKVKEIITDCENCQFKKFSEDMADKLAKVMIDNGITDFNELAKRCGVSYLHQDSITKSDTQL